MSQITPAIIPQSFDDLEDVVREVQDFASLVQVDVTDGVFVPEASWPYNNSDDVFLQIVSGEQGLPLWEKVDYEIDMMIAHPEDEWQRWVSAGASKIIFHLDATDDPKTLLSNMKEGNVGKDSMLHVDIGVAVGVATDLEKLWPLLEDVEYVQCMGIEHIGFQGQPFDERVLDQVRTIREKAPEMLVSVDGSMNAETIPLVKATGATRFAVGSALLGSENMKETYKELGTL